VIVGAIMNDGCVKSIAATRQTPQDAIDPGSTSPPAFDAIQDS
jgi:hypothetical protein